MVNHSLVVANLPPTVDFSALWEAYLHIATVSFSIPSFYHIYDNYTILMEGRLSSWQAQFYPEEFYDGTPGKSARRIVPDALMGDNNPFMVLDVRTVQALLRDYHVSHLLHHEVHHAAVKEVW